MKKLLCAILALTMILAAVFTMPVSAANDTLTITANGEVIGVVPVGSEFVYRVGLYAGEKRILNGQAHLDYDASYLSFVPFTGRSVDDDGEVTYSLETYSFPAKIRNANLVLNTDHPGQINYNFTRGNDGIAAFNDASKLFARFRFMAAAPGTADITNTIAYMIDIDEQQIYYKEKASTTVNPYQVAAIETPTATLGDANGDGVITIMDATIIQRAAVGVETGYSLFAAADVNCDKALSLRDVMYIKQYLANLYKGDKVGAGVYSSEIG